jgi:adenylate cyclase
LSRSISLAQLFFAAAALAVAVVAGAGTWFGSRSRAAALAASEHARLAVAAGVEARVAVALGAAVDVLDHVERALAAGLVPAGDLRALRALLDTELDGNPRLAELTFTGARLLAEPSDMLAAADAPLPLATDGRFQLSEFTTLDGQPMTALTERQGPAFVERRSVRSPPGQLDPTLADALDPTLHPTFIASVRGQGAVWSDLHFSELDRAAAGARVVLTVQKAVQVPGWFGVVRVGLLSSGLDAVTQRSLKREDADDPHLVALLAVAAKPEAAARLLTRVAADDELRSSDGELQVVPRAPPPALAALLSSALVRGLDPDCPARTGSLDVAGESWLVTLSPLSVADGGTRGWTVAVLVPQGFYTRELDALGRALILPSALAVAAVSALLSALLAALRRGLRQLEERTSRMRRFDFEADARRSPIADVDLVLAGLERAKTVARAMCRYIPVPLVRGLYERNQEPQLGGEPCELTLLFSDIQGFTSFAEHLPPAELALRLGQYLQVMTATLERHGATIDKYIGDAVMAFWNAPEPVADHGARACRAVVACREALAALYASPEWAGVPPLVTRFGLNAGEALVGHFGAPTRLSYTALGDAVNLAARLEGACKAYAVEVLVSARVAQAARQEFELRFVDRVVVRGKTEPVDVYELVGPKRE